jgi:S-adenosylmethionine hydrolase
MAGLRKIPTITLTTDFGLMDHYVGTMKGVLLSRCPDARLVDISHETAPFCTTAAAYTIDQAARYFPAGTVHLVVVDPGVGTARRPLLLDAQGQYFIAPDNGVLSMIVSRDTFWKARELSNRDFWLDSPSSTFHGRDIFAPVAAAVACGAARPDDVGPEIRDIQLLPDLQATETEPGCWQGKVLSVDRFGNIISNFRAADFRELGSRQFTLSVGKHRITVFKKAFGEALKELLFAYFGSSGFIEIGLNQASAASLVNAAPGQGISLQL